MFGVRLFAEPALALFLPGAVLGGLLLVEVLPFSLFAEQFLVAGGDPFGERPAFLLESPSLVFQMLVGCLRFAALFQEPSLHVLIIAADGQTGLFHLFVGGRQSH